MLLFVFFIFALLWEYNCISSCGHLSGVNVIGIIENMAEIAVPLASLGKEHSELGSNAIRLVNARGEDMTDSMMLR
jgi:hypothetical protein